MLTVPVSVFTTPNNKLLVVGNGKYEYHDLPIAPFKIVECSESDEGAEFTNLIGGGTAYIRKEEYPYLPTIRRSTKYGDRVEQEIDYVLETVKEYPDVFEKFTYEGYLPYPLIFDIETASSGHFPTADRDQIISIQVKFLDCDEIILVDDTLSQDGEIKLITDFLNLVKESPTGKTPDLMVGFFLNKFDVPYVLKRISVLRRQCKEIGELFDSLSRAPIKGEGRLPLFYPNWIQYGKADKEMIDFVPGLLTLDLYIHAKVDLELAGLPNRKLKTVSKAYGFEAFDIDASDKRTMTEVLLNERDKFMRYATSDVLATEYLYNIYIQRLIAAANMLRCPLSMVHRMSSGQKSYLALYRDCRKNQYHALDRNDKRYEYLYDRAPKYQGALVACYKRGYFPRTVYLDAKCISKDSKIEHKDYGEVTADTIKIGDLIWSNDGWKKVAYVENTIRYDIVRIEIGEGLFLITSNQHRYPVICDGKHIVKLADDLLVGDLVLESLGNSECVSPITNILKYYSPEGVEMVDIMLEDQEHPYFFANNILTHNSLYPNIMHDYMVSYDSYTLEGTIEYSEWAEELNKLPKDRMIQAPINKSESDNLPSITSYGPPTERVILIPDDNYELVLKFKFDLITEGFMRKLINYYNGERDRYKKLMNKYEKDYKDSNKEEDRIKAMMYNSFQGEAKIINNTFYGVQGNKYYDHADLPAAIFVTAIGRWTMTEMVRMFGKKAIIEMDSVTGDTPVYVRDKNTLALDIITIADLHIDSSIKRIKYSGNYQIMTRHGWADIEYTKAHKVTKDIHRIKISDGSVKLTCDHSLFDINEKEVSPKDIIKNNRIELLSSDIKETMFNVNNYHGLRPINKDIAWFYGLFLAEGSYSVWNGTQTKKKTGQVFKRNNRVMSISMQDRTVLEKIKVICDTYFIDMISDRKDNEGKTEIVQIYDTMNSSATHRLTGFTSEKCMHFFRKTFYCSDNDTKKVPIEILNCTDNDILKSFLEGYSLGDGCRKTFKGRKKDTYTSMDSPLLMGVRFIMHRLGYKTYQSTREDKLRIIDLKKRFPYSNGTFRKVDSNRVCSNRIISKDKEVLVYDVSTNDGTFVTACGDIVLHNTDGLLLDRDHFNMEIDDINKKLRQRMNEFFGIPVDKMNFLLEFEGAGSVYMYKRKNYILRKDSSPDKLTTKGSSFKGYDKAKIVQRATAIMAEAVMNQVSPTTYSDACNQARDIYPLLATNKDMFCFTKTLKKRPEEYKGFRNNIDMYINAVDHTLPPKELFIEKKKRAFTSIELVMGRENNAGVQRMKQVLRDCKTEENLKQFVTMLQAKHSMKGRSKSSNYLLDLIMKLKHKGREVEVDDILEYYYSLTSDGYTLSEDLKSDSEIDVSRYLADIDSIIERFSYADPRRKALSLMDLMEEDNDEIEEGFEDDNEDDED